MDISGEQGTTDEFRKVFEGLKDKGTIPDFVPAEAMEPQKLSRVALRCMVCEHTVRRLGEHIRARHPEFSDAERQVIVKATSGLVLLRSNVEFDALSALTPATKREFDIHMHYITQAEKQHIHVKNKDRITCPEPQPMVTKEDMVSMLNSVANSVSMTCRESTGRSTFSRDDHSDETPLSTAMETGDFLSRIYDSLDESLMFQVKDDIYNPQYRVLLFNPRGTVEQERQSRYGFYSRVVTKDHRLMTEYAAYLERCKKSLDVTEAKQSAGISIYLQYVERFMLCAMRARKRYGQPISLDDCLFSFQLLEPYFVALEEMQISAQTICGFAKALLSFHGFLDKMSHNALTTLHPKRLFALRNYPKQINLAMSLAKRRVSAMRTLHGTVASKLDGFESYSLACRIADDERVLQKVAEVVRCFETHGQLNRSQFNFFESFLIYWIVVKNTTRNEFGSKLCCGGVVGHLDEHGLVIASTGLRAYTEFGHELFVGSYPNAKGAAAKSREIFAGYFVVTKQIRSLLLQFIDIRDRIAKSHSVASEARTSPLQPFFVDFDGEFLANTSARYYFRLFLEMVGLGELAISCNQVRHRTAQMQYDIYCKSLAPGQALDRNVAILAAHSISTRGNYYVNSKGWMAVQGFIKLRQLEQDDYKQRKGEVDEKLAAISIRRLDGEHSAQLQRMDRGEDDESVRMRATTEVSDDDDDLRMMEPPEAPRRPPPTRGQTLSGKKAEMQSMHLADYQRATKSPGSGKRAAESGRLLKRRSLEETTRLAGKSVAFQDVDDMPPTLNRMRRDSDVHGEGREEVEDVMMDLDDFGTMEDLGSLPPAHKSTPQTASNGFEDPIAGTGSESLMSGTPQIYPQTATNTRVRLVPSCHSSSSQERQSPPQLAQKKPRKQAVAGSCFETVVENFKALSQFWKDAVREQPPQTVSLMPIPEVFVANMGRGKDTRVDTVLAQYACNAWPALIVQPTPFRSTAAVGRGVFATRSFFRNTYVCAYYGLEISTVTDLEYSSIKPSATRAELELSDIYRMDVLDGVRKIIYGHTSVDKCSRDDNDVLAPFCGSLINHSTVHPNLIREVLQLPGTATSLTPEQLKDLRSNTIIVFKALRDIRAGEELFYTYAKPGQGAIPYIHLCSCSKCQGRCHCRICKGKLYHGLSREETWSRILGNYIAQGKDGRWEICPKSPMAESSVLMKEFARQRRAQGKASEKDAERQIELYNLISLEAYDKLESVAAKLNSVPDAAWFDRVSRLAASKNKMCAALAQIIGNALVVQLTNESMVWHTVESESATPFSMLCSVDQQWFSLEPLAPVGLPKSKRPVVETTSQMVHTGLRNKSNDCFINTATQLFLHMFRDMIRNAEPSSDLQRAMCDLARQPQEAQYCADVVRISIPELGEGQGEVCEVIERLLESFGLEQFTSLRTSTETYCSTCHANSRTAVERGLICWTQFNAEATCLTDLLLNEVSDASLCTRCQLAHPILSRINDVDQKCQYLIVGINLTDYKGHWFKCGEQVRDAIKFDGHNWALIGLAKYTRFSDRFGHYVAYLKDGSDWVVCDESKVSTVTELTLSLDQTSALVYRKVD